MADNVVQLKKKTTDDLREIEGERLNRIYRQASHLSGSLPADPAEAILILQIALVMVARLDTLELASIGAMFQAVKSQLPTLI